MANIKCLTGKRSRLTSRTTNLFYSTSVVRKYETGHRRVDLEIGICSYHNGIKVISNIRNTYHGLSGEQIQVIVFFFYF